MKIFDDRGVRCYLSTDSPDPQWIETEHPVPAYIVECFLDSRSRVTSHRYRIVWSTLLAIPVGISSLWISMGPAPSVQNRTGVWLFIIGFALFWTLLAYGWPRMSRALLRSDLRDAASRYGFCFVCWTPYQPALEPDGCVVCPQCGAAWKVGSL